MRQIRINIDDHNVTGKLKNYLQDRKTNLPRRRLMVECSRKIGKGQQGVTNIDNGNNDKCKWEEREMFRT